MAANRTTIRLTAVLLLAAASIAPALAQSQPPPALLPTDLHSRFGYGIYSGRYGNIYTARQLLQLGVCWMR